MGQGMTISPNPHPERFTGEFGHILILLPRYLLEPTPVSLIDGHGDPVPRSQPTAFTPGSRVDIVLNSTDKHGVNSTD
jgi:hypothetical protein